jgi:hypothetical protein
MLERIWVKEIACVTNVSSYKRFASANFFLCQDFAILVIARMNFGSLALNVIQWSILVVHHTMLNGDV